MSEDGFDVKYGFSSLPAPKGGEFGDVKHGLPPPKEELSSDRGKDLQSLIDRIPKEIPDNFKAEAQRVAIWITELDKGHMEILNKPKVREWLTMLSARGEGQNEHVFPRWLREEMRDEYKKGFFAPKLDDAAVPRITEKYLKCGERNNWKSEEIKHDPYFLFNQNAENVSEIDGFKIYINGSFLESAIDNGKFEEIINELTPTSDSPSYMKCSDGGAVIYFHQKGQNPEQIKQYFLDKGISVGPPAQDVYQIIENSGRLEVSQFIYSNDSSGREWILPESDYLQTSFFESYLMFGLKTGKRLDSPNLTSFVYALTDKEELKPQAKELTDLPICFTPIVFSSLEDLR